MAQTNYSGSRKNAEEMARNILEYWQRIGYDITAWVEESQMRAAGRSEVAMVYSVRTNLVNGLPVQKQRMAA